MTARPTSWWNRDRPLRWIHQQGIYNSCHCHSIDLVLAQYSTRECHLWSTLEGKTWLIELEWTIWLCLCSLDATGKISWCRNKKNHTIKWNETDFCADPYLPTNKITRDKWEKRVIKRYTRKHMHRCKKIKKKRGLKDKIFQIPWTGSLKKNKKRMGKITK